MEPKILGELEVAGFSEFMHPVKDDNSMIITIGQNADEDGVVLGFQVSLFDSSVPTDPKLLDRLVLTNDNQQWSGSSASWDERAFRYIQVGELGRLIVPVYVYSGCKLGKDFQGFMVFGVDLSQTENIITKEMGIDHTPLWQYSFAEDSSECYCYNSLPERSMVFNGDLMTIMNQNVISKSLVTKTTNWNISFADSLQCCEY